MSIRVMVNVWDDASITERAELLVLLALADWANDRGECDPSYSQLAKKVRLERRHTVRLVGRLIERGILRRDRGQGFRFSETSVSNRLRLVAHVTPSVPQDTPPSVPEDTPPVSCGTPPLVSWETPTTVNYYPGTQLPADNAAAVVAAPSAAQDGGSVDEALVVACIQAITDREGDDLASYDSRTVREARTAACSIVKAWPDVSPDDIEAAAAAWVERLARIRKGGHVDPPRGSQLVEALGSWTPAKTAARRQTMTLVPAVER